MHSTGSTHGLGIWTSSMDWGVLKAQGYQLVHSLSLRPLKPFFDNVLLEHGGLPHVLPLTVHLSLFGQFVCPSPRPERALAKEKQFRSFGPLGSKLWPFKEGTRQIGPKIGAFLTLFVNPFSKGHNSGVK